MLPESEIPLEEYALKITVYALILILIQFIDLETFLKKMFSGLIFRGANEMN